MKITYVCHACLLIEIEALHILTDPWFAAPAYCGQWHVFPKPVNIESVRRAEVILISHGHEDHLHEPSLRALPHDKVVFFPYLWYGGTKAYLQAIGFKHVVEAIPYRKYQLNPTTSVMYLVNELDSIIVIEHNGKVLVNVNDALHADPERAIHTYTALLRKRYPQIDIMFCGFGGASYYPNTFQVPGKNDREIGQLREQIYIHNFCKITQKIHPRIAIPFAADFVLLAPEQQWVNTVRFPRAHIQRYYDTYFLRGPQDAVAIHAMYPGDVLDNEKVSPDSPYRARMENGTLAALIAEQYPEEISSLQVDKYLVSPFVQFIGTLA
jgi:hypothetical protein